MTKSEVDEAPLTAHPTSTIEENQAAFESAIHSLRLEGRELRLEDSPELKKLIRNEMTHHEAVEAIVARHRKD